MDSFKQKLSICQLLKEIANKEKQLEETRQKLARLCYFDKFYAFFRIAGTGNQVISPDDLKLYLSNNHRISRDEEIASLVSILTSGQNQISYFNFQRLLNPRNEKAKEQLQSIQVNDQVINEIEIDQTLLNFLDICIPIYFNLTLIRKRLHQQPGFNCYELFSFFDKLNRGFIEYQNINDFMKNCMKPFTFEEYNYLLMHLNISKSGAERLTKECFVKLFEDYCSKKCLPSSNLLQSSISKNQKSTFTLTNALENSYVGKMSQNNSLFVSPNKNSPSKNDQQQKVYQTLQTNQSFSATPKKHYNQLKTQYKSIINQGKALSTLQPETYLTTSLEFSKSFLHKTQCEESFIRMSPQKQQASIMNQISNTKNQIYDSSFLKLSRDGFNRSSIEYSFDQNPKKEFLDIIQRLSTFETQLEEQRCDLSKISYFVLHNLFRFYVGNRIPYFKMQDLTLLINDLKLFPSKHEVTQVLKKFDLDLDGMLSYSEFCNIFLPNTAEYVQMMHDRNKLGNQNKELKDLQDVFPSIDSISIVKRILYTLINREQNFDQFIKRIKSIPNFDPFSLFSEIDNNKDGIITFDDFSEFLKLNQSYASTSISLQIFCRFDTNLDGTISFAEFLTELNTSEKL